MIIMMASMMAMVILIVIVEVVGNDGADYDDADHHTANSLTELQHRIARAHQQTDQQSRGVWNGGQQ